MTEDNEKGPRRADTDQVKNLGETKTSTYQDRITENEAGQGARPKRYGQLKWHTKVYVDLVEEFAAARRRKPKGKKGPSALHIAAVYGRIEYRCWGGDEVCTESYRNIAAAIGVTAASVKRAVAELVDAGYLFKDERDGVTNVFSVVPFEELPGYTKHEDRGHGDPGHGDLQKEVKSLKELKLASGSSSEKPVEPIEENEEVISIETVQLTEQEKGAGHAAGYVDFGNPEHWNQMVRLLNYFHGELTEAKVEVLREARQAIRDVPNKCQRVAIVDWPYLRDWFEARWKAGAQEEEGPIQTDAKGRFEIRNGVCWRETVYSNGDSVWTVDHDYVDEDGYRTLDL